MNAPARWEYKAVSLGGFWNPPKDADLEATLNALGALGWEAVNVFTLSSTNQVRVLLKRPLSEDEARRQRRSLGV